MAIDLSSIATGTDIKPPKVALYGVNGIGKTTWAAGAPNPIFIFTEEGQGLLDVARFKPDGRPVVESYAELCDCLQFLHESEHSFETVVIDTLDGAEPLIQQWTCEKWHQPKIDAQSKEFGYNRGFGYALDEAKTMFRWLDRLRSDRGMAVVLLAQCSVKAFKDPESEAYERYRMRVDDRLWDHVRDWTDCLLFANYEAHVVKDKEGFGKERRRGVGIGKRTVYTEERPAFHAKNRYGLPHELEMSWSSFQNAIVIPETTKPEPKTEEKKA